jgi:tRNA/tmRNA/rRNA uracil-C5-methylase (TrmA/RlmC/RlmD family)
VDLVEAAVEDAKANAALNGIQNAEFVAGRAEAVLPKLLEEHCQPGGMQAVAIVDPPRPGLHKHVLSALRATASLRRLVYVSCNPQTMARASPQPPPLRLKTWRGTGRLAPRAARAALGLR